MAEKRKLAKDWRTSYQNAQAKVTKIENEIRSRLEELCHLHPEAEIGRTPSITKHNLYAKDVLKSSNIGTEGQLLYIEIIEKWLASQHPHQQSEIEFNKTDLKDFIEYEDVNDDYEFPERNEAAEVLEIRLYCMHDDCRKYIKGKEGYNGTFTAETGQRSDLRNQGFKCVEHRGDSIKKKEYEI